MSLKKTLSNKIIQYLLTILFIGLILFFSRTQWKDFSIIKEVSLWSVFWLSILFIIMQVIQSYILKEFVKIFDVKLRLIDCFGLVCMRSFVNYLPLNAGIIYTGTHLKFKNNLYITKYISITAAGTVLMFFTAGILGTILLLIKYFIERQLSLYLFIFNILFIIFGIVVFYFPNFNIQKKNRVFNWIASINEGIITIKNSGKLVIITLLTLSTFVVLSLRFYILFKDLGYGLDIIEVTILTIMTTLIRFTSLFPGNLGLREAIAGGVTSQFGFSFNIGFLAAIVDRIVATFWIFLFGIIFSFILNTGEHEAQKDKE